MGWLAIEAGGDDSRAASGCKGELRVVWTRASGRVRGWVNARATPVESREAAERVMKPSRVRWPFGATRRFLTLSRPDHGVTVYDPQSCFGHFCFNQTS